MRRDLDSPPPDRCRRCDGRATFIVDQLDDDPIGYCREHFHRTIDVPAGAFVRQADRPTPARPARIRR